MAKATHRYIAPTIIIILVISAIPYIESLATPSNTPNNPHIKWIRELTRRRVLFEQMVLDKDRGLLYIFYVPLIPPWGHKLNTTQKDYEIFSLETGEVVGLGNLTLGKIDIFTIRRGNFIIYDGENISSYNPQTKRLNWRIRIIPEKKTLAFGLKLLDNKCFLLVGGNLLLIDIDLGVVLWNTSLNIDTKYPTYGYILSSLESKTIVLLYVSGMRRYIYKLGLIGLNWRGEILWRMEDKLLNLAKEELIGDKPIQAGDYIIIPLKNHTLLLMNSLNGRTVDRVTVFEQFRNSHQYTIELAKDHWVLLRLKANKTVYYEMLDTYTGKPLWTHEIKTENNTLIYGSTYQVGDYIVFLRPRKNDTWIVGVEPETGEVKWTLRIDTKGYIIYKALVDEERGNLILYLLDLNYAYETYYNQTLYAKLATITIERGKSELTTQIIGTPYILAIAIFTVAILFISILEKNFRNKYG